MDRLQGPFPSPGFTHQVSANVLPPIMGSTSGEITNSVGESPMGAAPSGGIISFVWMSVMSGGQDDDNTLQIEGDVLLNGTTVLSTKPVIAYVSGEAAAQKTTIDTNDGGVTQAVLDSTNITVNPGDMFTFTFALTRTASPDSEIKHPCIVVEMQPN